VHQIVVVSTSPERRVKLGTQCCLNEAIEYAQTFGEGGTIEVVDERTGMLRATVERGKTERTVGSVRRPVLA
jgi:hypothetical protein